jgi:penicillin G amidase
MIHQHPQAVAPGAGRPPGRLAAGAGLLVAVLLVLAAAAALWAWGRLQASLPLLDGERALSGLSAPVTVERDGLGVPTITGASRPDVSRALGFVHAQDRFFQMDLARRRAAGELAELVGAVALPMDRRARVHRMRLVAGRALARATAAEREALAAYAAGVNAGLADLAAKPWEYFVLRAEPAPWRAEDTMLVVLSMFFVLQDVTGSREARLGLMQDVLPAGLVEFLAPAGSEWDAPLVGSAFEPPPVPGPEVVDLRRAPFSPVASARALPPAEAPAAGLGGSNNWAVAGTHTTDGGALVANDMHLQIGVPNTWYRTSLAWGAPGGGSFVVTGVTLPGVPAIVVGSNTRVAWGFTNTWADWSDLVVIETDPADPGRYLTPDGAEPFERSIERIRVKGAPDEELEIVGTRWGPVVDRDHRGRPRALSWVAHHAEAVNVAVGPLETARTLDEALRAANGVGIPAQNIVAADRDGRIGWTVTGRIPRRVGFDGRVPVSWADGSRRWDGWYDGDEYPRVIDPPSGRIWTANNRVVDGEMLARLGDGGYDLGARAQQIRDALLALTRATPRDMLAVQLDDRALFLERWRRVLLAVLTPEAVAGSAGRREFRRLVEDWVGQASIESVGYRLVNAWRARLAREVFEALTEACRAADERFDFMLARRVEAPLWALVEARPPHLLSPRHGSWDEQMLAAVDGTIADLEAGGGRLADRTWGERNRVLIRHPLSPSLPGLRRWLDMPADPLPGDLHMPRLQTPREGASQRMVVSPGREAEGLFHMPVGQSGHPRSPYYRNSHRAWVVGEATPFLPGPTRHTLTLRPTL